MAKAPTPSLSILMVSWNTREMTLASIASVIAQTRRTSYEIILVDNASHDGSADAVAAAFPAVRIIRSPENEGFARGNNIAAREARGDNLLLLNTDTIVLDGAIDTLVDFAAAHPDALIWGGRTVFADGSLNPTSCWAKPSLWSIFCSAVGLSAAFPKSPLFNPEAYAGWMRDSVRRVDIVSGCFFLITRDLWHRVGGFDRRFFMYGEEADLCHRASAMGANPLFSPEATIIHYGGASTVVRSNKIVYLMGAKIGLVDRQLGKIDGCIAKKLILFGVFWRALCYGAARKILRREATDRQAEEWAQSWKRRQEWRHGPLQQQI